MFIRFTNIYLLFIPRAIFKNTVVNKIKISVKSNFAKLQIRPQRSDNEVREDDLVAEIEFF